MILSIDDAPSQDEIRETTHDASEQLGRWRRRTFQSLGSWLLSCGLEYLFFAGHRLHPYWRPFGVIVYYLAFGILLRFIYCAIMWWTAWGFLRDLTKTYIEPVD